MIIFINDIKISENFWLYEFESPDTNEVIVDKELLNKLQEFRDIVGIPVVLNSAYRTPEYNQSEGGAENSYHTKGKAVDIPLLEGYTVEEMVDIAERVGFDGIGKYSWGIHVDVRGYKARWVD